MTPLLYFQNLVVFLQISARMGRVVRVIVALDSDRWCADTEPACYFVLCFIVSVFCIVSHAVGSLALDKGGSHTLIS